MYLDLGYSGRDRTVGTLREECSTVASIAEFGSRHCEEFGSRHCAEFSSSHCAHGRFIVRFVPERGKLGEAVQLAVERARQDVVEHLH